MTERTNLYAFTEPTPTNGYPGYVSLNREPDESVTLTVRSPGHGGDQVGTITLPPAVLRWLASAIKYEALGEAGVLGEQGRVLSLWDGRRWHLASEAKTMPAEFWQQDSDYSDTIPTR